MDNSILGNIEKLLADNDIFTLATFSAYGEGFVTTIQLASLSLLLGLMLAVPIGILRAGDNPWLSKPLWLYTYVFRGTPLLIQLYLIYYGVVYIEGIQESMFWPVVREAFYPCLLAFTLNTAAYTAEIFRGVIKTTPAGEIEAAKAYGMSKQQTLWRIIIPSAFRRSLPAYSNEVIFMVHATAIASTVTILDLTGAAGLIYSRYYAPFEAYLFVAVLYMCITFSIVYLFKQLEKKLLAHL